ncbi:2,4-dienoyl-CoA reductase [Sinomonas cellulolyticus]|uniref:FAD-dependent oxidoreductase n=1 Tax=Sinomonas cellulolyticus TaxID=2801916 RepID=A0ABS1K3Y9_9MICC|nr:MULTISPECIES: FAD-dependent oxidoreductase [Sinomonas]MBL0706183.1 FAD-dependent oxidoreductase [Sinomonas cellulolyticus]GHG55397.1 2,4-dienoyl-CoA reductase [Sinomonas sp. KCTC 49339]
MNSAATPLAPTPLTLGRHGRPQHTLRNRLVSSPMERNYGTTDGRMTEQYADYLVTRARAGLAMVTTEATYVRADGKGRTHQLGLHTDAVIPGFRELTGEIHAAGALAAVEINHGGRTAQSAVSGLPPVAPAAVPCEVAGGEMPRPLTTQECYELVEAYGHAARRAVDAGFDAISIHGGHGYLVHQFMSARTNGRHDEFGAPEHFANLVIRAVRAAAPEALVGIRVSVLEGVPGGLSPEQTLDVVSRLELDALDFLDLSAGSYEAGEWIVQSGEWKPGVLADYARAYRRFGIPLGMAGRLNSPEAVEAQLVDGVCDFVSLGRAVHADPAFVRGVLEGARYRPCIACNVCIDNLGLGQVTCTVNPAVGRSRVPVATPRVRGSVPHLVVLGAGPAGLTAARELAEVGGRVTLLDAGERIGGQFALAASMRPTPDFHRYLDWNRAELARLGVEVRFGSRRDPANLAALARELGADGIVVATGGTRPEHGFRVTGEAAHDGVLDVRDWLAARPRLFSGSAASEDCWPESLTIWGADAVAMSVADTLATHGTSVLIVGPEQVIAPESGRRAKILAVPRLEADPDVRIVLDSRIVEAEAAGTPAGRVRVVGPDGEQWLEAPGPVLVSRGVVPLSAAVDREGREAALGLTAGVPVVLAGTLVDQLPPTASNAIKSGYDAAQRLAAALAPEPGRTTAPAPALEGALA